MLKVTAPDTVVGPHGEYAIFRRHGKRKEGVVMNRKWRIYNLAYRILSRVGLWSPRMSRLFW